MITTRRLIFANAKLAIFRVDLFLQKGKYDKVCGFAKNPGKSVKINPRKNESRVSHCEN